MVKILIACSGFKDVLSPKLLCEALKTSFLSIDPELSITSMPLSDGGEGFISSLSHGFTPEEFKIRDIEIIGPLGVPITGQYGILETPNKRIGVVELAKVSGIEYVNAALRNPYNTTSHGTGQVIKHLYDEGIKDIYLGLGGSATTDGGLSVLYALQALNFTFNTSPPSFLTGSHLKHITSVSDTSSPMLSELEITIACDVNNPMLGPNGSAHVFGPQKGITPDMMEDYENLMVFVNELLENIKGKKIGNTAFTGAAGGVSGGILASFDKVIVKRGVDIISQALGLEDAVRQADIVVTGEGCLDGQTLGGKVVSKIKELRPDSIIVCGVNKSNYHEKVYDLSFRYGSKSITDVYECLSLISKEIYIKEIVK